MILSSMCRQPQVADNHRADLRNSKGWCCDSISKYTLLRSFLSVKAAHWLRETFWHSLLNLYFQLLSMFVLVVFVDVKVSEQFAGAAWKSALCRRHMVLFFFFFLRFSKWKLENSKLQSAKLMQVACRKITSWRLTTNSEGLRAGKQIVYLSINLHTNRQR